MQDLTTSHSCFSIFHGKSCPLNDQCWLPDQGFPVDSLELTIAYTVLSVEESKAVLGDLSPIPVFKQLHTLRDRVSRPRLKDIWVEQQLFCRLGQHLKARAKLNLEGVKIVPTVSKLP